ncbi:MAG: hypothetical protein J6I84_03355 [Bacilli bacterium]|nr:hypothetical protein [Bacilli bacterium]
MNIQPGYDPDKKRIVLNIELNLLSRYFNNFSGMILEDTGIPKDTEVEQLGATTARITFPVDPSQNIVKKIENGMSIGVNMETMEVFQKIINSFIGSALRKELKTTEFIPLNGYPAENLKEDIQAAVKNKRKLCIIQDFSEYQAMSEKNGKYVFHQYMVEHGTHEYTEVAILLYQEKLDELKKIFEGKLKLTNWC